MNATEGTALIRLMEAKVEAQVAPLRARVAELESEVRQLKSRDPERPGLLQRLAGAMQGGTR